MFIGLALLLWAALLAYAVPKALGKATWPNRAPRLGVLVWLTACVSLVVSVVLAGLSIAVPGTGLHAEVAHVVTRCLTAYRQTYGTPGGALAAATGLILALGVSGRVLWCLGSGYIRSARRRRAHVRALSFVARRNEQLRALVVDHPHPQAYCVPGRRGTVVITSAAVDHLEPGELAAVLEHERAHVAARDHIVVAVSAGLVRACPRLPLFRSASEAVPVLTEMAADDAAARMAGRATVATALATFVQAPPPATLGVAAAGVMPRIERLLRPTPPMTRSSLIIRLSLVVTLAGVPASVAVLPLWLGDAASECCVVLSDHGAADRQINPARNGRDNT